MLRADSFASRAVAGGLVLVAAVVIGAVYALRDTTPLVVKPNSLAVVNPDHNRLVGVVPIGNTPRGVAVGKDSVWTANSSDGTVSEIDPKTLKVAQVIGLGEGATDLVEAAGNVRVAPAATTAWFVSMPSPEAFQKSGCFRGMRFQPHMR